MSQLNDIQVAIDLSEQLWKKYHHHHHHHLINSKAILKVMNSISRQDEKVEHIMMR
ncbi:MAG TPA: hypothetical protein VJU85_03590 [Nitrososphaeraceae archaeon]|nr:hypothetical protein [Nitrososphaeraceae archaeon]